MFEEERAHLQPLPITGMSYFTEVQRTVCDDSCVRVEHSSYAARPAPIGTKVLVRIFERRIEIRDLRSQALLRTHARAERPGTVVLPMDERVFNPSRETRFILQPGPRHRPSGGTAVRDAVCHRGPRGPAQALGHRQPVNGLRHLLFVHTRTKATRPRTGVLNALRHL